MHSKSEICNLKSAIQTTHMSRNTKIILIVVGALVVICLGVCGVGYFFLQRTMSSVTSENPADAKRVAASIADYTLPEGYQELMGMDLFIYKLVMIAPERSQNPMNDGMVFMLMGTSAAGVNQADMERQMQQSFQQQFGRNGTSMEYVGQERVTIRGQEVTLNITESTVENSSGRMRQAMGTFNGKNGLVFVMVMGDASNWNDNLMREFLESIE
jgi:hypothetical protein